MPCLARRAGDIATGYARHHKAARLAEATQHPAHRFWPDAVNLLSPGLMAWNQRLTGRHITDADLLALAVENRGTFVTLDHGVPLAAVPGAKPEQLVVLEAPRL